MNRRKNRGEPGIVLLVILLSSCALFQKVLHTAEDAAEVLCQLWAKDQGPQLRLSPEDFCAIADNVRPFVDQALAAKQAAGVTVGARMGLKTYGQP